MVRRLEPSLYTVIPSGHHEHDSPPPLKSIKSGDSSGSSFLERGQYKHIHWDGLEEADSSAAPMADTGDIRAVVLLRFPGSMLLKSEKG